MLPSAEYFSASSIVFPERGDRTWNSESSLKFANRSRRPESPADIREIDGISIVDSESGLRLWSTTISGHLAEDRQCLRWARVAVQSDLLDEPRPC